MRFRSIIAFALPLVLVAVSVQAQKIEFTTLAPAVIESRLRTAPAGDSERELKLKELLLEAGCEPANVAEQKVDGVRQPNIICILPGEIPSQIIVGAHFDHVERGQGVVDNWSGASMLADLLQSLKSTPRWHTFVFIGFAGEERGLIGSEFYAKQLNPEQLKSIDAMINMDSVGMTTTRVWISHSDPRLVALLYQLAGSIKVPVSGVNVEQVGSADSESFAKRKVPVITVHSVTPENFRVLHSVQDKMRAISPSDYYETYRLLSAYLVACDTYLPKLAITAPAAEKK
jgi:putative aminopeptidase FrvX